MRMLLDGHKLMLYSVACTGLVCAYLLPTCPLRVCVIALQRDEAPSLQQVEAVLDFLRGLGMDDMQVQAHMQLQQQATSNWETDSCHSLQQLHEHAVVPAGNAAAFLATLTADFDCATVWVFGLLCK